MAVPTGFKETQAIGTLAPSRTMRFLVRLAQAFRTDARWWFSLILLAFVLAAIFAPVISPYPPLEYNPLLIAQGPSWDHPLGTDGLGRDQLSRVIWGARISLSIALLAILMGGILGTLLGLVAAFFKGWVDQLITIVIDAILAFPTLILALAIVASLGPSIINVAIALAVVRIPIYARLARGQTLQVVAQDYIMASTVSGTPAWKIMLRHVLPNIFSPLLVQATLSISFAILDESVLSFLGLGAQPPTPEWGYMINEAQIYILNAPWIMVGPALAIVLVVISLNLVGDALRDLLDPRDAPNAVIGVQDVVAGKMEESHEKIVKS